MYAYTTRINDAGVFPWFEGTETGTTYVRYSYSGGSDYTAHGVHLESYHLINSTYRDSDTAAGSSAASNGYSFTSKYHSFAIIYPLSGNNGFDSHFSYKDSYRIYELDGIRDFATTEYVSSRVYGNGDILYTSSMEDASEFWYGSAETYGTYQSTYISSYLYNYSTTISSGFYSTSFSTLYTVYLTAEYTAISVSTSTQNTDPYVPTSFTYTYSTTSVGRYHYTYTYTFLDDDYLQQLSLTGSESTEFVYLSQTTEYIGTSSFLTIGYYTSSTSKILTSFTDSFKKSIGFGTSTTIYQSRYRNATVIKSAGNWDNGDVGGAMGVNGGNVSVVQAFSDFLITTQNTTIDENRLIRTSLYEKPVANYSATYSRRYMTDSSSMIEKTVQQSFINTIWGWDGEKATSQPFEDTFLTVTFTDAYFLTTYSAEEAAESGSYVVTYTNTFELDVLTTKTTIMGTQELTNTYKEYLRITSIGADGFALDGVTTTEISVTSFDNHIAYETYISESNYSAKQKQSLDTETAKAFIHDSYNPLQILPFVLRKKHGQRQRADNIYLHTSNSNKTDNTGYFSYSNNLSSHHPPNPLTYSYPITSNQILGNYQYAADNQYANNAGFGITYFSYSGGEIGTIVTPMSQSSYSFERSSGSTTTNITVTFNGVSEAGSYTKKIITGTTFTTMSGLISHEFAQSVGTGHEMFDLNNYYGSLEENNGQVFGGKLRLYTALDVINPNSYRIKIPYQKGNNWYTAYKTVSYLFTNVSSDSSYSGLTSFFGDSTIYGLKYISYENDSWTVTDYDIIDYNPPQAMPIQSPETVFRVVPPQWAQDGIIVQEWNSQYGSTYWNWTNWS